MSTQKEMEKEKEKQTRLLRSYACENETVARVGFDELILRNERKKERRKKEGERQKKKKK